MFETTVIPVPTVTVSPVFADDHAGQSDAQLGKFLVKQARRMICNEVSTRVVTRPVPGAKFENSVTKKARGKTYNRKNSKANSLVIYRECRRREEVMQTRQVSCKFMDEAQSRSLSRSRLGKAPAEPEHEFSLARADT